MKGYLHLLHLQLAACRCECQRAAPTRPAAPAACSPSPAAQVSAACACASALVRSDPAQVLARFGSVTPAAAVTLSRCVCERLHNMQVGHPNTSTPKEWGNTRFCGPHNRLTWSCGVRVRARVCWCVLRRVRSIAPTHTHTHTHNPLTHTNTHTSKALIRHFQESVASRPPRHRAPPARRTKTHRAKNSTART
jgi:hypothetical protein